MKPGWRTTTTRTTFRVSPLVPGRLLPLLLFIAVIAALWIGAQ